MVSWEAFKTQAIEDGMREHLKTHVRLDHSWVTIERGKHARLMECSECSERRWSMSAVVISDEAE